MHIFIDESGGFIPLNGTKSRVSCIAALMVPSAHMEHLFKEFAELQDRLFSGSGEIKGSRLGESEIAQIIDVLKRYDVVVEAVAIDVGVHQADDVAAFKEEQARKIMEGLPMGASEQTRRWIENLRDATRALSDQLFVQGFMMIVLLDRVLETGTMYYSQRRPAELAEFHWTIDRKDKQRTALAEFWTQLIFPALQVKAEREPTGFLEWGDYSAFERHLLPLEELPGETSVPPERDHRVINIEQVLTEHLDFPDSQASLGLQLADIVVNAFCRALNRRLKREAWTQLGRLMVHRNPQCCQMVILQTDPKMPGRLRFRNYHGHVAEELNRVAKSMIPTKFRHKLRDSRSG